MNRLRFYYLIIFLSFICFVNNSHAYNDTITHPDITEKAVLTSALENYLKNSIGLKDGLETTYYLNGNNFTILDLFREGAELEDEPDCRASNHFHNPLKAWGESHLTDDDFLSNPIAWLIRTTCEEYWGWEYSDRKSNITWATGFLAPGGPKYDFSNTEPEYAPNTWDKAREYYYNALTAGSKDDRESNFALTFGAVGQVVHLLEDMAVPAHTRNDFVSHVRWNQIDPEAESWVAKSGIGSRYEYFVKIRPALVDATPVYPTFTNLRLTDFWDTDQYTWGSDPLSGTSMGLAEYTNSNFLSSTSIFKSSLDLWHYFPHPEKNSVVEYDEIINGNKRTYLRKLGEGETDGSKIGYGERIEHLARSGWLYKYIPVVNLVLKQKALILDDVVYLDYAEKLLPRAVGYSAGLLDYFFRGELHVALLVSSVDQVSPTFGNQNDTGSDIDTVAVFIQNNSKIDDVIEPIGEGTLTLTISYTDSTSGSTFYESADTVSVTQIPEKDSGSYFTFLFTLTSPIPTQTAEDITYYFAFRGQLGNEEDAVIGKVIKGPLLYSVTPDNGLEEEVVTLTGNNLPTIDGPFPTTSEDVRFHHDLTKPYTVEVTNKTDTDITVKVPNTAGLLKPGYGGLRVQNILDTGEEIYSNPVSFFPIAEGEVKNIGQTTIDVTIEAIGPIVGDYNQLPQTINISALAPGASQPIQLMTGFTYTATANTSHTQDIEILTPDLIDFTFEVE